MRHARQSSRKTGRILYSWGIDAMRLVLRMNRPDHERSESIAFVSKPVTIAGDVARYIVLDICQHSNTYAAISSFNPKAR